MDINISNIRPELPDLDFPIVTKQAVSKARQGILPSLFKDLFSLSTDIFYNNIKKRKMWRGKYNIFAVDGSRISIPCSKSNYEKYGEMFSKKDPNRRWSMALCSTIYDVCNDFIIQGVLKPYLGLSEMPPCSIVPILNLSTFLRTVLSYLIADTTLKKCFAIL